MLDSLGGIGGAETLALELVERLDPERYERWLCLTRWSDEIAASEPARSALEKLDRAGVGLIRVERSSPFALHRWIGLVRTLRRLRPSVIHAHKFGSNAWAVLVGRLAGVPVIIGHEHMWSYEASGPLRRFVDRAWVARGSDALIAVSREGRRQMIEVERVDPDHVTFIPNGVPPVPAGDGPGFRARLGIGPEAPLVGTLARLRPEKALGLLVEAAGVLGRRWPDMRVVIAGDGEEEETLRRRVEELGLSGTVLFPGYVLDVAGMLDALDVAVCCSRFEGGPVSVMEYMDAAVPTVATEVGGIPELIEDGVSGLLVRPGDPNALAGAIARLLEDPVLRARLGSQGRERKRREHDIGDWVARVEDLYASLLATRAQVAR
jgi:glycosyltransferase involved in cell wall biosynthesis